MDWVKFICYGLLAGQFFFFVWLLSSMIVDGRFKAQESNGNILIFELILAGAMIIGAVCLRISQLHTITKN
ncbi:hypothetical protein ACFLTQ_02425 [Chloroflexota bacterium]